MLKKFASLKRWLTLEDAANHLSLIFDESVSKTDLIQLALEGRLTLSVWLPKPASTIPYKENVTAPRKIVHRAGKKGSATFETDLVESFSQAQWSFSVGERLFEPEFLKQQFKAGLWDFPLVEHTPNNLILGEKIQAAISASPFEEGAFQPHNSNAPVILQHIETSEYWGLVSFKEVIEGEDISGWKRRDFFNKHHSLPATATIVISQAQLRAFVDSVSDADYNVTSPEGDSEVTELRRTQRTLAALAGGLASKYPAYKNGKKPNASQLAKLATEHLRDVTSDRTPHGFSETTARLAIAEALKACPDLTET